MNRRKINARRLLARRRPRPTLLRPRFVGLEAVAWTDTPPAQYPTDTVRLIGQLLELGDRLARIDLYRCDGCQGLTMVRMTHPGIAPKVIDHDRFSADTRCTGTATSLGYPEDYPADWTPSHEFYRPSELELTRLDDVAIDHVLRGGLLLRLIPLDGTR